LLNRLTFLLNGIQTEFVLTSYKLMILYFHYGPV